MKRDKDDKNFQNSQLNLTLLKTDIIEFQSELNKIKISLAKIKEITQMKSEQS